LSIFKFIRFLPPAPVLSFVRIRGGLCCTQESARRFVAGLLSLTAAYSPLRSEGSGMACYNPAMDSPKPQPATFADYRTWDDDQRWEIIDGVPYAMSSPPVIHQALVGSFYLELAQGLRGKGCQVFVSPLDVKLSDTDVVQPDLLVVCQRDQLLRTHVEGAPTLVVEILSPSSTRHDRVRKLNLYARVGVPEYWLVTPEPPMLEQFVLVDGVYQVATHMDRGTLTSRAVPGLELDLDSLFQPVERSFPDEVRERTPPYAAAAKAGL
jgi:Uma2 family endonuclease